jgi:DNA-binding PucR family transcriptional regulator
VSTLAGAELVYRAQANLRAAGAVVFVVEWNGAVIAFWPSSRRSSDVADELQYRWLAEGRLGFVPDVAGLAEVPAAAESAFDIAQAMRSDQSGLVTFTAVWERMAKQKLENSSTLLQQIIGGLDDCPDDERERLTETVHSYLVEGNVAAVAAQLYCHRNTIVKRLQRFQALTGLDVNRPRDAALALLALS